MKTPRDRRSARALLREAGKDIAWGFATLCVLALVGLAFAVHAYRPANEDEIQQTVAELRAFIERERGMPFLRMPRIELLDSKDYVAAASHVPKDPFDVAVQARSAALLQALRLQPPGLAAEALDRAIADSGSLGHYSPADHVIRIRGRALTPRVRVTLAHELEHALWGPRIAQWERESGSRPTREAANATQPLREGSAVLLEHRYRASLTGWERRWESWERAWYAWRQSRAASGAALPEYNRIAFAAVYPLGEGIARALLQAGGHPALAYAQQHGLASSEQLLDPRRYFAGEAPAPAARPAAGGPVEDDDRLGAFDLGNLLLIGGVRLDAVQRAVAGWGGDRYVLWREQGRACVRVALVGDTARDTEAIAEALRLWAQVRSDAQVVATRDSVTFTSCQAQVTP